jgi:CRP-like cAMP-binding protein
MSRNLREAAWMARCSGRGEFSPFATTELRRLNEQVGVHTVEAGTPLMVENRRVPFVGVIHEGEVELHARSGIRRLVLQVLRRGDVFGDIPFLCRVPAPFGARALTEVILTKLDPDAFWTLLQTHPHLCERFLFSMASGCNGFSAGCSS